MTQTDLFFLLISRRKPIYFTFNTIKSLLGRVRFAHTNIRQPSHQDPRGTVLSILLDFAYLPLGLHCVVASRDNDQLEVTRDREGEDGPGGEERTSPNHKLKD